MFEVHSEYIVGREGFVHFQAQGRPMEADDAPF